ncbi:hypothetical protein M0H32_01855 [Roseibium sp. CAU 1639]|uniref:Uncharacterized protein n=1 Tax=Roseibium sediminicola TaxID=2933272 RepID=A0ABT0GN91_9HYPH|nr:hypothetical protein [Roseibium sp. CAU 1639]MCK7610892.1 hypothetical protein [Roseibium sp. CAU 1639]
MNVELEAAHPAVGLRPGEAGIAQWDRRGVDQLDQTLAFLAQPAGHVGHQMAGQIAEDRRRAGGVGVRQGRLSGNSQPQVIERLRPGRQGLLDLAQAGKAGQLGEQQGLEMALAGPGPVSLANTVVALVKTHHTVDDATVEWFQNALKGGTNKRHGRPPKIKFGDKIFDLKRRQCLSCNLTHPKNPGQLCAKAGMTTGENPFSNRAAGCGSNVPNRRHCRA